MGKRNYQIGDRFYYANGDYWELAASGWIPVNMTGFWWPTAQDPSLDTPHFRRTLENYEIESNKRVPNNFVFKARSGSAISTVRTAWLSPTK